MLSARTFRAGSKLSSRHMAPLLPSTRTAFSAVGATSAYQIRSTATTTPTTPDEAHRILLSQRLKRPLSPHLTIYQPQITWYLSGLNRVTGVTLAGAAYLFAISYVAAPYAGWHLESATLAAAFGSLPIAAKVGVKAFVAAPFTFHCWNGMRHLLWDTGRELTLRGVYRTGYVVLGLTAVSTAALALM